MKAMSANGEFRNLLTPGEVAQLFRVDPKTVSRWARKGQVPAYQTPGGHHRFDEGEIMAALDDLPAVHVCAPRRPAPTSTR